MFIVPEQFPPPFVPFFCRARNGCRYPRTGSYQVQLPFHLNFMVGVRCAFFPGTLRLPTWSCPMSSPVSVCVCVIIIWNRSRGQFRPWPFVLWSLNRTWNHRTVFLLSSWLTRTMVRSKSGEVIYFTIPGSMSDSGHVRPSSGHGHASANGEFGSSIGRYRYEHVWSVPFFFGGRRQAITTNNCRGGEDGQKLGEMI